MLVDQSIDRYADIDFILGSTAAQAEPISNEELSQFSVAKLCDIDILGKDGDFSEDDITRAMQEVARIEKGIVPVGTGKGEPRRPPSELRRPQQSTSRAATTSNGNNAGEPALVGRTMFQLELTTDSQRLLRRAVGKSWGYMATRGIVPKDEFHVTLLYVDSSNAFDHCSMNLVRQLWPRIGDSFAFTTAFAPVPCGNLYPHITLGVAPQASARESNDMLQGKHPMEALRVLELELSGNQTQLELRGVLRVSDFSISAMASQKKYYVILMDVLTSLPRPKVDLAIEAAKLFVMRAYGTGLGDDSAQIQQKLIVGKKSTQVALVLMGSRRTRNRLQHCGYQNIDVVKDLAIPGIDYLRCLSTIEHGSPYSTDIVNALIVALDLINSATGKEQGKRTVLILTDGCTPVTGAGDLPSVVQQMNNLNIEPIIATFGTPLPEVHTVFESLVAQSERGQYLQGGHAVRFVGAGVKSKDTQQISKCRVDLELTKYMKIPVWCYLKTSKVTLPTLGKESTQSSAPVKLDRAYYAVDDPDGEAIPADDRVKAYKYGTQYVPFAPSDEASLKYHSDKCLTMLGFARSDTIPEELMIGESIECVAAEPNNLDAAKALSSLIKAMQTMGVFMLARYCFRNDVKPKYVCLAPHVSNSHTCLYMNQLPFSDDVRTDGIIFDDFDTDLADKEALAVDRLMDCMNLEDDGDYHELLKMKHIYNPTLLRFWRTVIRRAEDPDAPIVGIDKQIDTYLHPERTIEARFIKEVNALRDVFPLVKVPVDNKKKNKRYWRDIANREAGESSKKPLAWTLPSWSAGLCVPSTPCDSGVMQVFDFPTSDPHLSGAPSTSAQQSTVGRPEMFPQIQIGMTTPVRDFTTAVYGPGVTSALLNEAFQKMAEVTARLLQQPGYDYIDKAVDCVVAMRQAGLCYGDDPVVVGDYHRFVDDSLANYKDSPYLAERIRAKKITYITTAEAAASTVTEGQAEAFLQPS
ncbi:X-ray repair cross-complementing protein 5 [Perkinsus olseni]|uniref:X-ray repair cross-complementing protein 5 n=1 Tax=Perkinsus olseni TaxID=32597 RepID=A0A7J6P8X9_PEROL|nr:X-ray repair cross-complementing protein 5 [Perkinsus olseni]